MRDFWRKTGYVYILMDPCWIKWVVLEQECSPQDCLKSFLLRLGPVSYTHLDVYKRQITFQYHLRWGAYSFTVKLCLTFSLYHWVYTSFDVSSRSVCYKTREIPTATISPYIIIIEFCEPRFFNSVMLLLEKLYVSTVIVKFYSTSV